MNLNRLTIFVRKQPCNRLNDTPVVNLHTSGATASNEESGKTESENMYPEPTSKMTRIIICSILPVLFMIFEIGFWSYNRSIDVDDLGWALGNSD